MASNSRFSDRSEERNDSWFLHQRALEINLQEMKLGAVSDYVPLF